MTNRWRQARGFSPKPYKWLIQLTNDCNSRCQTCDIWRLYKDNPALQNHELSLVKYRDLFRDNGQDLRWLAFSGGEVTLYPYWDELLELIKEFCPNLEIVTFTTNGLLPEKALELAKKLQGLHSHLFVVLSLDGDEQLHDKLRGVKGNAQLVHQTKKLLEGSGIQVYLGATLSGGNADFWMSQASKAQSYSLVHSGGIFEKEVELNDHKILQAINVIIKKYPVKSLSELGEYLYLRLTKNFLKQERKSLPLPCASLKSSLHFTPYGEIKACMFMPVLGNLKEKNLSQILSSAQASRQLEQIKNEQCPRCWMNCYAPHSILEHPLKTLVEWGKSL